MGWNECARDRQRSHGCSSSLPGSARTGQNGRGAGPRSGAVRGPGVNEAARRPVGDNETRAANRSWWDGEADDYYAEHGAFLGDASFVWGPEGWTEDELDLLAVRDGMTVLEIGAGAAQCSRWLARAHAVRVVATDLSMGMLRRARALDAAAPDHPPLPYLQVDGTVLPLSDGSVDRVFTAYGVVPFVADSAAVLAEAARVLRPGGRFVFSTSHPVRWAFPDDPGPRGLTATTSYFDRTPYVESESGVVTYAEHHRTLGDLVRQVHAAGLVLVDLVEPEWPERNEATWGGWSPLRGRLLPGTAILVCDRPA